MFEKVCVAVAFALLTLVSGVANATECRGDIYLAVQFEVDNEWRTYVFAIDIPTDVICHIDEPTHGWDANYTPGENGEFTFESPDGEMVKMTLDPDAPDAHLPGFEGLLDEGRRIRIHQVDGVVF